jgi:hypothetical protein
MGKRCMKRRHVLSLKYSLGTTAFHEMLQQPHDTARRCYCCQCNCASATSICLPSLLHFFPYCAVQCCAVLQAPKPLRYASPSPHLQRSSSFCTR